MAPKRKSPAVAAAVAPAVPSRITRSMAAGKQAADAPAKKEEAEAVPPPAPAGPKGKKKAKKEDAEAVPPPAPAGPKGKKKAKKEEAAAVVEEVLSPPPAAKGKGKKNAKKDVVVAPAKEEEEEEEGQEEEVVDNSPVVEEGKRVVVEACTQCQQFKKRAMKVKADLESAVPGVSVTINPEKPRRGCLEIREEVGEVFISLRDMKRPFQAMRELDMDKVIQDIVKKIS